ncbi:MAG: Sjogren's syndrome/scleroderma autoantigen 1 family protein [Nitrososphaerota archaeon]
MESIRMQPGENERVRRIAAAIKSGAKLRTEVCPVCGSPLVEMRGEVRCVVCDRPVVIVRDEAEAGRAMYPYVLSALEEVVVAKLEELTRVLAGAAEPEEVGRVSDAIDRLLAVLRKGIELEELVRKREGQEKG